MWSDEIPLRTARGFGPAAVTPHELSTMAAIEIMSRGGNAVDGAIAANAVQGTVAPETCGVGGDLFALVYHPQKGNPPACLNSSGRAGSGADASSLRQAGHRTMPEKGPPSVTVPGCVDGWYALSERFGRRPLAEVLGPAIRLAENGFAVSRELSEAWAANATQLLTQASASPMFPDGRPPRLGESITRPYLAETLRSVISGRDSFYLDRLGTEIPQATDHLITKEDLARCQADWVDPWSVDVFGKTVWTTPPNSQGYLTLASLWIFEHLEVPPDLDSPDYWQGLIEAYRSMAWERDQALHDPQTGPPPNLLGMEILQSRLEQIDLSATCVWPPSPPASGGTAYMCTVDREGMAVSLIQSNFHGIGSGLSAGRTGVWLHNRGAGFNLVPGHPNEWKPGRRPLHTLSPTIWTENGRLSLVLGTRGGHQQPQLLTQVGAHLHHGGLGLAQTQLAPRWTIRNINSPDRYVSVERRTDPLLLDDLRGRGQRIRIEGSWEPDWGPISMISVSPNGLRSAVADPRVETALALTG